MNARDAIKLNLNMSDMIVRSYLSDLSDSDLLIRPVPGTNHIAWQLGHLICSEHDIIDAVCPGAMPALPAGFADRHNGPSSKLDSPSAFCSKEEYLRLYGQQRAATLAALDRLTEQDLDKLSPEKMRNYTSNVGDCFSLQGSHYTMHAGQWAVVRRKLGRAPLF
ncbi:MAG: DinB family protein [Planctomycetaceae bacterium]